MFKKAIYFPFLIGMAQLPVVTKAQLNKEKGAKHIVVNATSIRVADLLGLLSRETDLEFSFNSKKLSPSRVITVTRHDQTLSAWLMELEKTTGIHVRVKDDHIILQDTPPAAHATATRNTTAKTTAVANNAPAKKNSIAPDKSGQGTSVMTAVPKQERVTPAPVINRQAAAAAQTTKSQLNGDKHIADTQLQREEQVRNTAADHAAIASGSNSTPTGHSVVAEDAVTASVPSAYLSGTAQDVPAREEIRLLPAHELATPDRQIDLTNSKSVNEVKAIVTADTVKPGNDNTGVTARPLRALTKMEFGLLGAGIAYELPVGQKFVIEFASGIGGGYDVWNGGVSYELSPLSPSIYLSVNPRYYYNRDKRARKNRTDFLNAGNYWGVRFKYTSPSIGDYGAARDALLMNVHWGMQRSIGGKWILNGHAGLGLGWDLPSFEDPQIYPALEFKISYVLNKKRNL
ncbi:hypothetical protein [Chitinophaga rhizophila]|uniref:Uncharacterized protein n=1 Tax=Chitinophaga rhizophila TaxID=2866212 RepID=A0ABS7GD62_9BACT|nr:hypothetical protein [Chitinophaga rhizophila]MBW8685276.1 hypothetical protein [Chitinophaga rhizophila]